jgi:hypothetical protein
MKELSSADTKELVNLYIEELGQTGTARKLTELGYRSPEGSSILQAHIHKIMHGANICLLAPEKEQQLKDVIESKEQTQIDIWAPYDPFIPNKRIRSPQDIIEDAANWINDVVCKVKMYGEVPKGEIQFTHILMSNLLEVNYIPGRVNRVYYDFVTDLRVVLMKKYGISLRTLRFRCSANGETGGYAVETRGQFSYVSQLLDKMVSYGSRASMYISQIEARQLEIQDPQLKERIQRIRPQLLGMNEKLGTSRIRIGKRENL